jgi:cell fate regulator YaaT (PSP1 superfamily)
MVIGPPSNGDPGDDPPSSACIHAFGGAAADHCGSGPEKVYPNAVVRYGYLKHVGEFSYPDPHMKFGCGAPVVIQSSRGLEFGEMVSLSCNGCDKSVSREQIRRYVDASGPEYYCLSSGRILRLATPDDQDEWQRIKAETGQKREFCQRLAEQHQLPMKVVDCEHTLGGERIIFYFMSEGRIDFRSLVKDLADEYQTRIEMKQVGARDEARLLADYETCGRECCCKNFLKSLKPISMRMAKMQKATLDPAKVSGRCGRLKCCLRYEHVSYEELDRRLPPMGATVTTTGDVEGRVVARQILTQLLQIETADGGRVTLPIEEVREVMKGGRRIILAVAPPASAKVEPVEAAAGADDEVASPFGDPSSGLVLDDDTDAGAGDAAPPARVAPPGRSIPPARPRPPRSARNRPPTRSSATPQPPPGRPPGAADEAGDGVKRRRRRRRRGQRRGEPDGGKGPTGGTGSGPTPNNS